MKRKTVLLLTTNQNRCPIRDVFYSFHWICVEFGMAMTTNREVAHTSLKYLKKKKNLSE